MPESRSEAGLASLHQKISHQRASVKSSAPIILSALLTPLMVSCAGFRSHATHFMVRGVDEDAAGVEVMDPTEVCTIIDMHADSRSLRSFSTALSSGSGDNDFQTAQNQLIKEILS